MTRPCMAGMAATLTAVLVLNVVPVVAQCAMCRTALKSPEAQHLVAALRMGILFLLVAPFVAFGTVAYLAVRTQRRARHTEPSSNA